MTPSIVLIAACFLYEVIARDLFNKPTTWAYETACMAVILSFIAGGYVQLYREHISVDIFYKRWPIRGRAIVDLVSSLLLFFFVGVFIWQSWDVAWASFIIKERAGTAWGPPIYPAKFLFPAAGVLLFLQGVATFARSLVIAITGKEMK